MADAETQKKPPALGRVSFCGGRLQTPRCDFNSHPAELTCYHEFVPAKSSLYIGVAKAFKQQCSRLSQRCGADVVPQAVVYLLEPVKIEE